MTVTTPNLFGKSLDTKSYFWCCPYPIEQLIGQFVTKFWRLCGYSAESLVTSALKNRTITYWDCGVISTLLNDDVFKNLLKTKDLSALPRIADAYRFIHNDHGNNIITNAVNDLIGKEPFDETRVAMLANVVMTADIASKLFPHITKFSYEDFARKVKSYLPDREYVERALENHGADWSDYEVARRLGKLGDADNKFDVPENVWIKCNDQLLAKLFETQNYSATTLLFVLLKREFIPHNEIQTLVERIQTSNQLHCSGGKLAAFLGSIYVRDEAKGKLLETLNIHVEFTPAEFLQVPDQYAYTLAKCVRYDFPTVAEAAAYDKRGGEQEGLLKYVKETFSNEAHYSNADLVALANLRRELGDTEWKDWFVAHLEGCDDCEGMLLFIAGNEAYNTLFAAAFDKLYGTADKPNDEIFALFEGLVNQESIAAFKIAYSKVYEPVRKDYQVAVFKKYGVTWEAHKYLQHVEQRMSLLEFVQKANQRMDAHSKPEDFKKWAQWNYMFREVYTENGSFCGRGFPIFFEMTPGETTEAKLAYMVTNQWGYLMKNGATLAQFAEKAKGCDLEVDLVVAAAARLYPEELGIAVSLDAIPETAMQYVAGANPHAGDNNFHSSHYARMHAIRENLTDSNRAAWEAVLNALVIPCTSIDDFLHRRYFSDSEASSAFRKFRIEFSEFERVMNKIEGNEGLQIAAYESVLRNRRLNDDTSFPHVFGFVMRHPEWKGTEEAKAFLKEFSSNYDRPNWRAPLANIITKGHLPNGITQEVVNLLAELDLPIRAYDFIGVAAAKNIFAEAGTKLAGDLNDLATRNVFAARPVAAPQQEALQLSNGCDTSFKENAVEMINEASKEAILSAPALPLVVWNTEACRAALVEKLGAQDAYDFFRDNKRDDATERPQIHYIQEDRLDPSDTLVAETRDAIDALLKPAE